MTNEKDRNTAQRIMNSANIPMSAMSAQGFADLCGVIEAALTTARKDEREAAFKEAAQRLRNRAEIWRQEGERWHQQALTDDDPEFLNKCYLDRDTCLAKMSGALVLATEFDKGDRGNNGRE